MLAHLPLTHGGYLSPSHSSIARDFPVKTHDDCERCPRDVTVTLGRLSMLCIHARHLTSAIDETDYDERKGLHRSRQTVADTKGTHVSDKDSLISLPVDIVEIAGVLLTNDIHRPAQAAGTQTLTATRCAFPQCRPLPSARRKFSYLQVHASGGPTCAYE